MDRGAWRATVHEVTVRHNLVTKQQTKHIKMLELRADSKKHPLVNTFREYAEKNCPSFMGGENHYMSSVLPKNRKIIYKLLRKKLYFAVKLIFKIKG